MILVGKEKKCWDIVYNEGKFQKDILVGYCFFNDSQYYAYHYYGNGKTPFNEGDFDGAQGDTDVKSNLRTWKVCRDTLYLRWKQYVIIKAKTDTLILSTGVASNPKIVLVANYE